MLWTANSKFLFGTHAVIFDVEGRVLLQRHTYRKRYPWGLPGGWVRRPESPHEALRREVSEETGLQISVGPLVAVQAARRDAAIVVSYLCTASGQPRTSPETSEVGFFALDSLPKPLAPDQIATIELAARFRRDLEATLRAGDFWGPCLAGDTDEHY